MPVVFNGDVFEGINVARSDSAPGPTFTVRATDQAPSGNVNRYQVFGTANQPGDTLFVSQQYNVTPGGRVFFSSFEVTATQFDSSGAIQFSAGPSTILFSNTPLTPGQTVSFANSTLGEFAPAPIDCFVSGTLIATRRGEVPVEALQVGDLARTADGSLRPIDWIGQRHVERPTLEQAPVRIRAGAFGEAPTRDLYLSPGHPVLVGADADGEGGVLVPVMCLVNGTTIARTAPAPVTYWHVELDRHDILLAEGLAAESYLDLGTKAWFAGADGALVDPDTAYAEAPGRCRPVATDGPVVEAERARLDTVFAGALSAQCGWEAVFLAA